MFDIGWSELFVVLVVALVVVGPKDLPKLMRWAGYWTNRARMMAGQFQRVMDEMAREAELDKINQELRDSTRIDMHPGPASPPRPPAPPAGPGAGNSIQPPDAPPAGEGPSPADLGVVPVPTPVAAEVQAGLHGPIQSPDLPQPETPAPVEPLADRAAGSVPRPPEP
ncbi:Sec-independent protein translocase protein TatB [Zavarzinia sp. CC-PAN008]|uniref:Sec-independent protein translocase protein TatB n=1 Tax=Zavarzinia sp. CC-PAN008 TaxID=3243332 RepID=UPI003F747752